MVYENIFQIIRSHANIRDAAAADVDNDGERRVVKGKREEG